MRAWIGSFAILVSSCGILEPDPHALEGDFDLTMSFVSSTRRGPCQFPETGYCYSTDSVAFQREGVLVVSDVRNGTVDAAVTMGTTVYGAEDPLEGAATVSPEGAFRLPRRTEGGQTVLLTGTIDPAGGIAGDVRIANGIMGSSTGTFVGTRRPR